MKKTFILLIACLLTLVAKADNITFLDEHVKSVCVQNWDTNGDGELSMEEAAAVTKLNTKFSFNAEIIRFPELQYFTGLASISTYDFYSCKNLRSIVLPPQITSIGTSAFFGCINLQEIIIPDAVKTIYDFAFNGCSGLKSVTFSEGLNIISENAFNSCYSLQGIAIPSTVNSIALSAFWSCSSLTTITVDPANTVYDSRDNCNALINTSTNTLQLGTTTTVIPETVTAIGPSAFYGNALLQTINIPEGVQTIGGSAFSGCTALTTVTLPSTLTSIGNSAFSGCKKLSGILLQEGLKTIGQMAFNNCSSLKKIFIPSTVTKIDYNAFSGCSRLTKVAVMSTTPISIGTSVFPYYKKSTLYVPKGCLDTYNNATTWKDFMEIVEIDRNITVTVDPEELEAGVAATLTVNLTNDDFFDYHSLTMDITLPRYFSIDADNVILSERCTGMTAKLMPLEGNIYRLTCSSDNAIISGTEGTVFTLGLQLDENVPAGLYKGKAKNTVIVNEYGTQSIDDVEFSWKVIGYEMGDVNHDGEVSLLDIMILVNRVLEIEQEIFYPENADMDYDGEFSLADIMLIVEKVLNQ